MIKQWHDKEGN